MKRQIFALLFLFALSSVFAQANDAQRIVGTWQIEEGNGSSKGTITFNANGTFSMPNENDNGQWFVTEAKTASDRKLVMRYTRHNDIRVTDYYFSSDGKWLMLWIRNNSRWLIKQ